MLLWKISEILFFVLFVRKVYEYFFVPVKLFYEHRWWFYALHKKNSCMNLMNFIKFSCHLHLLYIARKYNVLHFFANLFIHEYDFFKVLHLTFCCLKSYQSCGKIDYIEFQKQNKMTSKMFGFKLMVIFRKNLYCSFIFPLVYKLLLKDFKVIEGTNWRIKIVFNNSAIDGVGNISIKLFEQIHCSIYVVCFHFVVKTLARKLMKLMKLNETLIILFTTQVI